MKKDHGLPETMVAKIKRIFELWERAGSDAEKEVAKNKLDLFLEQNGVTLDDLGIGGDEVVREVNVFEFEDPEERSIIIHLAGKFNGYKGEGKVEYFRLYRKRKSIGIKLTRVEAIDFKEQYAFYREEWQRQKALFFAAFLDNNDLTRQTDNPKPSNFSWADLETMRNMRRAIPERSYHRSLAPGKPQLPG